MSIKNRKILQILALCCVAFCVLCGTFRTAGTVRAASAEGQVVDTYGLFSDAELAELETACAAFEQETGIRTAILSVDASTVGGSRDKDSIRYIEAYADALPDANFIGLLINMDTRYYYIDVCGDEALRIYTDSRQEQLGDAVVDRLAVGAYAEAGKVFLNRAAQQCAYARENQSYGTIREEKSGFQAGTFGIAAALSAVLSGILTATRARKHAERRLATDANRYVVPGTVNLHRNRNVFVSQYVTRVPVAREEPRSGGGGGGFTTTHSSGGGSMHSGHGGHF